MNSCLVVYLGAIQLVKPSKAIEQLSVRRKGSGLVAKRINLITDHIVGPFDFTTINKETNRISSSVGNEIRTKVNSSEVDPLSLDCLVQLDSWKRYPGNCFSSMRKLVDTPRSPSNCIRLVARMNYYKAIKANTHNSN